MIKELQHILLDDHCLQFSISKPKGSQKPNSKRKYRNRDIPESNKIIYRNVPFEATRKDVREIFKKCGPILAYVEDRDSSTARITFGNKHQAEAGLKKFKGVLAHKRIKMPMTWETHDFSALAPETAQQQQGPTSVETEEITLDKPGPTLTKVVPRPPPGPPPEVLAM